MSLRSRTQQTWLSVAPAMALPFLASLFYFVLFSDHWFARAIYGGTKVFTLIWPLVALKFILDERLPRFRIADPQHRAAAGWGLLSGACIVALMFALMQTGMGVMALESASRIRAKAEALGILRHYWAFGLFLALAHSFLEEYYWRWFVYGRLRDLMRAPLAHALAGASFAAHHIVVATQFFPFLWGLVLGGLVGVGGIIWSLLYERQRTLAGAWISHIIADLGILSLGHKILFGTYF